MSRYLTADYPFWHLRQYSGVASYGALGHVPLDFQQFHFSSLWSKSESQPPKYCVVCEISWCRCQQLTALSISTALVTKLLVDEQSAASVSEVRRECPWHNLQLCPSSQQILATPLRQYTTVDHTIGTIRSKWPANYTRDHFDKFSILYWHLVEKPQSACTSQSLNIVRPCIQYSYMCETFHLIL